MSRILIVDDEENIRLALSATLEYAGYAVYEAASGAEAVDQAIVSQPDVVLMDIAMPGLDGFSALNALHEQPATYAIPVLMLTALSNSVQRVLAPVLVAFDHFTKPLAQC